MVFWFLFEPGYHLSGFLHMNGFNVAVAAFLLDFQKALYGMSLSPEHSVTKCPIAGIDSLIVKMLGSADIEDSWLSGERYYQYEAFVPYTLQLIFPGSFLGRSCCL